jgi:hypothetical protein
MPLSGGLLTASAGKRPQNELPGCFPGLFGAIKFIIPSDREELMLRHVLFFVGYTVALVVFLGGPKALALPRLSPLHVATPDAPISLLPHGQRHTACRARSGGV